MPDKVRLTVDLDFEQGIRLRKNLEWGEQGHIFRKIVSELNNFIELYGKVGVALMMSDKMSLIDLMALKEKREKKNGVKGSKTKHT